MTLNTFSIHISTFIIFSLCLHSAFGILQIRTRRNSSKWNNYQLNFKITTWDVDSIALRDGGVFTQWVPITSPEYFTQTQVTATSTIKGSDDKITSKIESFTCYQGLNSISEGLLSESVLNLVPNAISGIEIGMDVDRSVNEGLGSIQTSVKDMDDINVIALAVWDDTDATCQGSPKYIFPLQPWTGPGDNDRIIAKAHGLDIFVTDKDEMYRLLVQTVTKYPSEKLTSFRIITTKDAEIMPQIFRSKSSTTEIKPMKYTYKIDRNEEEDLLSKTWTFDDIADTTDTNTNTKPQEPGLLETNEEDNLSHRRTKKPGYDSIVSNHFKEEESSNSIFRYKLDDENSNDLDKGFLSHEGSEEEEQQHKDNQLLQGNQLQPDLGTMQAPQNSFNDLSDTRQRSHSFNIDNPNPQIQNGGVAKNKAAEAKCNDQEWQNYASEEQKKALCYKYGVSLADQVNKIN